jgi:uncharacterized Zn-binding protein involved in type VI secretion
LSGLLAGVAIGGALLFTAATGGAGGVLLGAAYFGGAGLAAGGALAGAEIGKLFDGELCGVVITGSPDTFLERRRAARAGVDQVSDGAVCIAQGSATVFVNNAPLARRTDHAVCGGLLVGVSRHTFIGGPARTVIEYRSEIPGWITSVLQWTAAIGGGVALVLTGIGAGVVVAGLGFAGALGGGYLGGKVGGAVGSLFGERAARVGEILGTFGGGLWGAAAAAKLAPRVAPPFEKFVAGPVKARIRRAVESRIGPAVAGPRGVAKALFRSFKWRSPVSALRARLRRFAPEFSAKVEEVLQDGWVIRFAKLSDGPGSYCRHGSAQGDPVIVVGRYYLHLTKAELLKVNAHEVGHARYELPAVVPLEKPGLPAREVLDRMTYEELAQLGEREFKPKADEYVEKNLRQHLDDEGNSVMAEFDAFEELSMNGDVQLSRQGLSLRGRKYQDINASYRASQISRQDAIREFGELMRWERPSNEPKGVNYDMYYGRGYRAFAKREMKAWLETLRQQKELSKAYYDLEMQWEEQP